MVISISNARFVTSKILLKKGGEVGEWEWAEKKSVRGDVTDIMTIDLQKRFCRAYCGLHRKMHQILKMIQGIDSVSLKF